MANRKEETPLTPVEIGDLVAQSDRQLGEYLSTGEESARQAAEREAAWNTWTLCNAIGCLAESPADLHLACELGKLAATMAGRMVQLQEQGGERP